MTSGSQTVDLSSNLRAHYEKTCKRAIECFLRVFPTFIVHELRRHLSEHAGLSRITVKFDLWWPLVTSCFTLVKTMTEILSVDLPSFRMPFAASRYVA